MHIKYRRQLLWNNVQEKWAKLQKAIYRTYINKMKKKTKEMNKEDYMEYTQRTIKSIVS